MLEHSPVCCGVRELGEINFYKDPAEVIATMAGDCLSYRAGRYTARGEWQQGPQVFEAAFAHVIFTGVTKCIDKGHNRGREDNYGLKLSKWIEKQKLGTVVASPSRVNPNTGNKVTVWIWTVNKVNLIRYFKTHKGDLLR